MLRFFPTESLRYVSDGRLDASEIFGIVLLCLVAAFLLAMLGIGMVGIYRSHHQTTERAWHEEMGREAERKSREEHRVQRVLRLWATTFDEHGWEPLHRRCTCEVVLVDRKPNTFLAHLLDELAKQAVYALRHDLRP